MADLIFNLAKKEIFDGTIDILNDTVELMLLDDTGANPYTADATDDFVDEAGANDPIDGEYSGSGYTGGHAGAGRQEPGSETIVEDDPNGRAEYDFADVTWSSLGSGSEEASAAILIKQGSADDTTARLIAYNDSGGWPVTTNGGDLTLSPNAEGFIQLS